MYIYSIYIYSICIYSILQYLYLQKLSIYLSIDLSIYLSMYIYSIYIYSIYIYSIYIYSIYIYRSYLSIYLSIYIVYSNLQKDRNRLLYHYFSVFSFFLFLLGVTIMLCGRECGISKHLHWWTANFAVLNPSASLIFYG